MIGQPVRAIVFDAVGTLIQACPPVAVAYAQQASRFGVHELEAVIRARFGQIFAEQDALDQRDGNRTSEARERERWRAIVAHVFPEVGDPQGLYAALWSYFGEPSSWALFDDVAPLWSHLPQRGMRLALASNFDSRLHAICRGLPPLDTGLEVFVSSELGVRKPGPEFFAQIAAQLELDPGAILMVGDDLTNDYQGALAAGWQSVLIDRQQSTSAVSSTDRLTSLAELAAWLER